MTNAVIHATNFVTYAKVLNMARNEKLYSNINSSLGSKEIIELYKKVQLGVPYSAFVSLTKAAPFDIIDWSEFLHLSRRTLERNRRFKKAFDPLFAEKILAIMMVYHKGLEVWENKENFDAWLIEKNIALGGICPKELLKNSFGIELLRNEIGRIEYGILA